VHSFTAREPVFPGWEKFPGGFPETVLRFWRSKMFQLHSPGQGAIYGLFCFAVGEKTPAFFLNFIKKPVGNAHLLSEIS
jgi:hypothetical protein